MRLIIVGLAFVLLAVGLSEYQRRHPAQPEVDGAPSGNPGPPGAGADDAQRGTLEPRGDLLETVPPPPLEVPSLAPVEALLSASTPASGDAGPTERQDATAAVQLLHGRFVVRRLQALDGVAVAVVESDGLFGLVELRPGAPARALAATRPPVTALAVGGEHVFWSSADAVLRVDRARRGVVPVVKFRRAEVVDLAAHGEVLLAALQPKGMDVFSEEPVGAIARIRPDGRVAALRDGQVRPHDVATDGRDAYWVSGYPSGLFRAALDGTSSTRLAPRADGPLALVPQGLAFRVPGAAGSELRFVERSGSGARRAVRADADWVASDGDSVYFVTTGLAPRLFVADGALAAGPEAGGVGDEGATDAPREQELLRLPGAARGLAASQGAYFVAVLGEDGRSSLWGGRRSIR